MNLYTNDLDVDAILKQHKVKPQINTPENRYALAEFLWWPTATSLTNAQLVAIFHRCIYKAVSAVKTVWTMNGSVKTTNYMTYAETYYKAGQDRGIEAELNAAEIKAKALLPL